MWAAVRSNGGKPIHLSVRQFIPSLRPLRRCCIRATEGAQFGYRNWFSHATLRSFASLRANSAVLGRSLGPASHIRGRCRRLPPGPANSVTRQFMNPSAERTRAECCPGPEMQDRPRMIDPRSHRARYPRHRVVLARIRALLDSRNQRRCGRVQFEIHRTRRPRADTDFRGSRTSAQTRSPLDNCLRPSLQQAATRRGARTIRCFVGDWKPSRRNG